MSKTMSGKVAVVTGGTSGIGKAIAAGLARQGAKVIVTGRDEKKGAEVADALAAETGSAVTFVAVDLLSQRSVRALAASLLERHPKIDVLVNNAGAAFWERGVTGEGIERSLALNLIAPFLLTELLLPALKAAGTARVVNVATKPRPKDVIALDDLMSERSYDGFGAYGRAKTGLIAWTYELSRRLRGTGVAANCLHPGVVLETNFSLALPKVMQWMGPLFATLSGMRATVEQAADTAIWLASEPTMTASGGFYIKRKLERSPPEQTHDDAFAGRLWTACEKLVSKSATSTALSA